MGYSLTTDKGGFLRIEDEDASVTFRCNDDRAQLLSVMVSEDSRGRGVGKSIISAAEAELFRRGISVIKADFLKEIEGIPEFLQECGYTLRDSIPVVSVDMGRLLAAKAVRKAMRCSFNDGFFMPADDIQDDQRNELIKLFNKLSIPIVKSELNNFSEELSGVVYSDAMMPKAFIFCSSVDDLLYVDFLGGISKKEPQYIMIALLEMLRSFEDESKRQRYKNIAMLLTDKSTFQLLKRALDEGTKVSEFKRTFHAEKKLSDPEAELFDEIPEVLLTERMTDNLAREFSGFPIQKNICWKPGYSLNQRGAASM